MQDQTAINKADAGASNLFDQFFDKAAESLGYSVELAKIEFTENILARMRELHVSRTDLAQRMNASPALITKLLNGKNNFELATMVKMSRALKSEFRSKLQPEGCAANWVTVGKKIGKNVPMTASVTRHLDLTKFKTLNKTKAANLLPFDEPFPAAA